MRSLLALAATQAGCPDLPVEVQDIVAKLESTDHYSYEWSDVCESEQIASRLRSLADFDTHEAWDRTCEGTREELELLYPGSEFLRGRVVDKAKIYNNELCGRSRWTPKGFMQKQISKRDCEAPTALEQSAQILELLGLSLDFDKSLFDFSEAFFNSKPFGPEDPYLFVEILYHSTKIRTFWTKKFVQVLRKDIGAF